MALCTARRVPLVVVKQLVRAPVVIDSVDTLDAEAVRALYERHRGDIDSFRTNRDKFVSINQRYVVSLSEAMARSSGIPVIDFVRAVDREGAGQYFVDYVHPNAAGNSRIAEYLGDALPPYLPSPPNRNN